MNAGFKERNKYRDMSWLMPSIDLDSILLKLGIIVDQKSGKEVRAFCPDHHLYTGRKPSDPNWVVSKSTGETYCFTESRGSNLVWTVCRLLKCEPNEAAKFLTGKATDGEMAELSLTALKFKQAKLHKQGDEKKEGPAESLLRAVAKEAEIGKMSEAAYQFFIHPPGKKYPTNISRETVKRYRVFERTWGFYANRVFIPYYMGGAVVGFCAIDILGKEEWLKRHPTQDIKQYRKVRYPENFISTKCLFGFDDCEKNAEYLVIVEGAREVMKLTQEGIKNAVAILGAYLSDDHFKLITKLSPKRIVLMFDGDDAGVAITTRVAQSLKRNFKIQKCFLPRGRDPKTLDHNELIGLMEKHKIS